MELADATVFIFWRGATTYFWCGKTQRALQHKRIPCGKTGPLLGQNKKPLLRRTTRDPQINLREAMGGFGLRLKPSCEGGRRAALCLAAAEVYCRAMTEVLTRHNIDLLLLRQRSVAARQDVCRRHHAACIMHHASSCIIMHHASGVMHHHASACNIIQHHAL